MPASLIRKALRPAVSLNGKTSHTCFGAIGSSSSVITNSALSNHSNLSNTTLIGNLIKHTSNLSSTNSSRTYITTTKNWAEKETSDCRYHLYFEL